MRIRSSLLVALAATFLTPVGADAFHRRKRATCYTVTPCESDANTSACDQQNTLSCPGGWGCPSQCSALAGAGVRSERLNSTTVRFHFVNNTNFPVVMYPAWEHWDRGRLVLRECQLGAIYIPPNSEYPLTQTNEWNQNGPRHGINVIAYHTARAQ